MTFQQSIQTCLNKYADFKGKASRSEYWWFFLFTVIVGVITGILDVVIFPGFTETLGTGPLRLLFNVAVITPGIAVGARRLHDTNRSGWWQLLYLTVLGIPVVWIFMALPTREDENSKQKV
mgnify:FL=1